MFFAIQLLQPQHKARLYYAWVAGTRGIAYLNKKDVLELDVEKICREVQSFVCTQSASPHSRFSLRLSAILVNGIVKINKQKAMYVMDELFKILSFVAHPVHITMPHLERRSTGEILETPPTPVIKKKGKKRVPKDTPESQLAQIMMSIAEKEVPSIEDIISQPKEMVPARIDDITLRESHVEATRLDVIGEAGGDFGPPLLEFEQLKGRFEFEAIREITPLEKETVPRTTSSLTSEVHLERRATPSSEEVAPMTFTVEAMVHASAGLEQRAERRDTIQRTIREEVPMEIEEISVLREIQPIIVTREAAEAEVVKKTDKKEEDKEKAPKVRKPKEKTVADKNLLLPKRKKTVKIDRSKPNEDIMLKFTPLPQFRQKMVNFSELLMKYLIPERESRPTFPDTVRLPEILETPEPSISVKTPQPVLTSTPAPRTSVKLEPESMEQLLALTPREEVLESPRKRQRLEVRESEPPKDLEFISLPSDLPSQLPSEIPSLQPETVESGFLPVITEQQRQQDIVNKIFEGGQMTLEEVCQKPVNRMNIARAFNDVLVLSRYSYVTLISEENSSELKYIAKGPKMNA